MPSPWPVEVLPLKPVACGAIVWRMHGALRVTVVIKAAFGLVHEHDARLIAPTDLVRADRHPHTSSAVEEIFDLAPYLPNAGVLVSGHACAPSTGATASSAVRVILFRDETTVLDKTLHIFGDRDSTPAARPLPFLRMPLVWERTRAHGGPGIDDNPVGVGALPGSRAFPNIVDAVDPRRPAGFGPVGARWPARARLLGGAEPPALDRDVMEIPDGFDWRWFQAAPADQQVSFLTGSEWIALDGMHPSQPRLQSRLPSVQARARWYQETSQGPTEAQPIELGADTLSIDADRQTCWVVWRGNFALESLEQLPWIRVQAGVEIPGYPINWPEIAAPPPLVSAMEEPRVTPVPAPAPRADFDSERTAMIDIREIAARALRPVAPFALAEPGARAQPSLAGIPGAPSTWVTEAAAPDPTPTPGEIEADTAKMKARRALDEHTVDDDGDPMERTSRLRIQDLQRPIAPFALAAPGARPEASRAAIPGAPWSLATPAPAPVPFDPSDHQEGTTTFVLSEAPRPPAPPAPPVIHDDGVDPDPDTDPDTDLDEPPDPMAMTTRMRVKDRAPPPPIPVITWGVPPAPSPVAEPIVTPPMVAPPMVAPPTIATPTVAPAMIAAPTVAPAMVAAPMVATATVAPATVAAPTNPPEPAAPASELRLRVLARLASGEPFDDQDLSRGDLADLDFRGRSLVRCNLRGSTLARCNFDGARLEGAQLGEADLTGASLVGADLTRADLSRATVARARFDRARLVDAKLASAEGKEASFRAAAGQRASFARGAWEGAVFDEIDVVGADFTGARLDAASFRDATILEVRLADAAGAGAIFDGARLRDARAKGASLPRSSFVGADVERSVWGKAQLDGARFDDANLRGVNLAAASCVGAAFTGANLEGATLLEAAVAGARFTSANLRGARMERVHGAGVDLEGAALDGADLRHASLAGAGFAGAALRKARADNASFEGASFARADLTEASLRAAVLRRADLTRSILRGADLRDADLEGANVHGSLREGAKMSGARTEGMRDEPEPEPR